MQKSKVGKLGERMAANYLQDKGYKILDLNYQNNKGYKIGEIDIIGKEKKTGQLVFFEVKTRIQKDREVLPEENVTGKKLKKIFKAIEYYLRNESLQGLYWRLDLVAVILNAEGEKIDIRHTEAIYF